MEISERDKLLNILHEKELIICDLKDKNELIMEEEFYQRGLRYNALVEESMFLKKLHFPDGELEKIQKSLDEIIVKPKGKCSELNIFECLLKLKEYDYAICFEKNIAISFFSQNNVLKIVIIDSDEIPFDNYEREDYFKTCEILNLNDFLNYKDRWTVLDIDDYREDY